MQNHAKVPELVSRLKNTFIAKKATVDLHIQVFFLTVLVLNKDR